MHKAPALTDGRISGMTQTKLLESRHDAARRRTRGDIRGALTAPPGRLTEEERQERHAWALAEYRSLATGMARRYVGRGEPFDDLHQVALMALIKAADRFDAERGVEFPTYACKVIAGELKRHFRDRTWTVRVPRPLQELHLQLKSARDTMTNQLGRAPTVAELAERLGVGEEQVLEAMEAGQAYRLASLDAPPRNDPRGERQNDVPTTDGGFAAVDRHDTVERLLERLPEEDQLLLRLYYLHGLSQSDIGARLGMSQVHVSRRLANIIGRARAMAVHP